MSFFTSLFSVSRLRRAGLALCVFAFLFVGCETDPEPGALNGVWKLDGNTSYTIDTAAKTVVYHPDLGGYGADIVNSPDYSAPSGVLIILFKSGEDVAYNDPNDVTPLTGKYGALYWTDLTPESVKIIDAWKTVGEKFTHIIFDTKAEALATFTLDAAAEYLYEGTWDGITPYNK